MERHCVTIALRNSWLACIEANFDCVVNRYEIVVVVVVVVIVVVF
jgi:hypothetical protein